MSICQSIAQAINRSISHFFFLSLFLSQRSSLYPTLPFPQRCFSAAKQQAGSILLPLSSKALRNFYWLSLRSGCSAPVNRFLQVLVLCRTVPTSFRSPPTKPSGSAPLVRPDDILLHRRVTHIHHPDRFDSEFPSSLRSIFPRRLAYFLARSLPSEALIWRRHWTQPDHPRTTCLLCVCARNLSRK